MNYDTSENQNYQGLQNPSSSYSNNQNPSGSYLKNQNPSAPPTRVAQAKTAASKLKLPTDNDILKILFPGEIVMKKVIVSEYLNAPSILVREYDYWGAWTNSATEIYIKKKLKPNGDIGLDGFERIKTLYHEGLHILQFEKYKSHPKFYQDMLKYELEAYGDTVKWLSKKQAEKLRKKYGMGDIAFGNFLVKEANNLVYLRILEAASKDGFNDLKGDAIYNKEILTKEAIDEFYFNFMVDEMELLPDRYEDKGKTIRYTINDLYKINNKTYFPLVKKKG